MAGTEEVMGNWAITRYTLNPRGYANPTFIHYPIASINVAGNMK